MRKTDIVLSYLMKITKLRDQLTIIGEDFDESELVQITLNGFGPSWHYFVQCICTQKLPTFEKLWDDLLVIR
jgi:hypothetical protein